jgi:hypothetical protein
VPVRNKLLESQFEGDDDGIGIPRAREIPCATVFRSQRVLLHQSSQRPSPRSVPAFMMPSPIPVGLSDYLARCPCRFGESPSQLVWVATVLLGLGLMLVLNI